MASNIINDLEKNTFSSGEEVSKTSKNFGVSFFAFQARALNLSLIS